MIFRLRLHWRLPSLASPVTSLTFHPKSSASLVVTQADNSFIIFEADEMTLSEWSKNNSATAIKTRLAVVNSPICGVTFDPSAKSSFLLHSHGCLVYVDLTQPVPKNSRTIKHSSGESNGNGNGNSNNGSNGNGSYGNGSSNNGDADRGRGGRGSGGREGRGSGGRGGRGSGGRGGAGWGDKSKYSKGGGGGGGGGDDPKYGPGGSGMEVEEEEEEVVEPYVYQPCGNSNFSIIMRYKSLVHVGCAPERQLVSTCVLY